MKIKKKSSIVFYLFFFTFLSNCVQPSSSIFSPLITGAKTGNVYQSGLSYVSSDIIKKKFGKTPTQYVTTFINQYSNTEKNIDKKSTLSPSVNLEVTQDYNDTKDDHKNFMMAVKKMLK